MKARLKFAAFVAGLALACSAIAAVTVIDLTKQVSGILPEANGGTGTSTYQRSVISGHCTGAASTSLAVALNDLGATAATCTTTSTTNVGFVVTTAGTVKNLYVQEGTTQKSGTTLAWTVQKCTAGSCSGQTLTCTVANAGTACNDTTHSFTVAAGDIVQIKSGSTASTSETVANIEASMELWN
jgi:hypothetical protein